MQHLLSPVVRYQSKIQASVSRCVFSTTAPFAAAASTTSKNAKKVVVVGGGIQGTSVAYYLAERGARVTILEATEPTGRGGGLLVRNWGQENVPDAFETLHEKSYEMYKELVSKLELKTYRTVPILWLENGYGGVERAQRNEDLKYFVPRWLTGKCVGDIEALGFGDDCSQVTPSEVVEKMLAAHPANIQVIQGRCVGLECRRPGSGFKPEVTGVQFQLPTGANSVLKTETVVICAGAWSCAAEDWLKKYGVSIQLPMEGIASTLVLWEKPPELVQVDGTVLLCSEDLRFNTHLEVYPRPNGETLVSGRVNSNFVTTEQLKQGAFMTEIRPEDRDVEAVVNFIKDISLIFKDYGKIKRIEACLRPCPPDEIPYIGKIHECQGVYINAGHDSWGVSWAPACGKGMAELIFDGSCSLFDITPFNYQRLNKPAAPTKRRTILGVEI
jgi:glycine/D-amino acid oxidase-like deaminating enzyme